MARYLLDTNHLSNALEAGPVAYAMHAALLVGHRFGTCVPVVCETEVGIRQTARRDRNQRALANLISELRIWPVDLDIYPVYADTRVDLKRRGRHMSQIDIMIASIARIQDAIILTTDRDFEALPDIKCENWIA